MARPKEFVPDEVLGKAMDVFWRKGYEATSVEDLVSHMGINRGSLYETFGDKHQLFCAALDRYCRELMGSRFTALTRSASPLRALREFFQYVVTVAGTEAAKRGCLVTNSAMELAPHDQATGKRISMALSWVEDRFYDTLVRARAAGELDQSKDLRALARALTCLHQGLAVMVKAGADKKTVRDAVTSGLSILK